MSETIWDENVRPARRIDEGTWHLLAAALSLLFGLFCIRWVPLLAFEAAAALALLALCIARPFVGLMVALALTLGLDQIGISTNGPIELDPFTEKTHFFVNLNSVARLPGLYLNFMEVMLVTCWLSWGVRRLKAGTLQWRGGAMALPLAVLGLALVAAVMRGVATGGLWKIALWSTRGLFQLIIVYLLAAHMMESRSQVRALFWTIIGALLFRALMALYHLGVIFKFSLESVDSVTTHEEGIFFASMLLFWMVLQIYRAEPAQRRTLAVLLPLFVIAFIAAKRRAAMVALICAIPYLLMIVDWRRARQLLIAGFLALPLLLVYTVAFWNSTSTMALPVGLVRSLFVSGDVGRMETSNLYRLVENEILTSRIRQNPLTGMGFGHLFVYGRGTIVDESGKTMATDLAVSSSPLAHYIAHNQILWLWSMGGLLTFGAFWFFVAFAVAHGTRLVRTLQTPYFKAVALLVTLLVCMQMLVSYGDQQLTEYRTMVYLGLLLGTMVRLPAIERQEALQGESAGK